MTNPDIAPGAASPGHATNFSPLRIHESRHHWAGTGEKQGLEEAKFGDLRKAQPWDTLSLSQRLTSPALLLLGI